MATCLPVSSGSNRVHFLSFVGSTASTETPRLCQSRLRELAVQVSTTVVVQHEFEFLLHIFVRIFVSSELVMRRWNPRPRAVVDVVVAAAVLETVSPQWVVVLQGLECCCTNLQREGSVASNSRKRKRTRTSTGLYRKHEFWRFCRTKHTRRNRCWNYATTVVGTRDKKRTIPYW